MQEPTGRHDPGVEALRLAKHYRILQNDLKDPAYIGFHPAFARVFADQYNKHLPNQRKIIFQSLYGYLPGVIDTREMVLLYAAVTGVIEEQRERLGDAFTLYLISDG